MDLISREKAINALDVTINITVEGKDLTEYEKEIHELGKGIYTAQKSAMDSIPSAFEGMTNRDVLNALFPIDENKGARFTKVYLDNEAIESFELLTTQKWLDSPYKGVSE